VVIEGLPEFPLDFLVLFEVPSFPPYLLQPPKNVSLAPRPCKESFRWRPFFCAPSPRIYRFPFKTPSEKTEMPRPPAFLLPPFSPCCHPNLLNVSPLPSKHSFPFPHRSLPFSSSSRPSFLLPASDPQFTSTNFLFKFFLILGVASDGPLESAAGSPFINCLLL